MHRYYRCTVISDDYTCLLTVNLRETALVLPLARQTRVLRDRDRKRSNISCRSVDREAIWTSASFAVTDVSQTSG